MNIILILIVSHLLTYYAGKNAFRKEAQSVIGKLFSR